MKSIVPLKEIPYKSTISKHVHQNKSIRLYSRSCYVVQQ